MGLGSKGTPSKKEVVSVWMKTKFDDESPQKGRETWAAVRDIDHELTYDWDPADPSGSVTAAHGSVIITKAIGPSSPLLAQALALKEDIGEVVLEYERDATGGTAVYYEIKLEGCRVSHLKTHFSDADQRAAGWPSHMEQVGFAYKRITWTWKDPQILGHFDFDNPAGA